MSRTNRIFCTAGARGGFPDARATAGTNRDGCDRRASRVRRCRFGLVAVLVLAMVLGPIALDRPAVAAPRSAPANLTIVMLADGADPVAAARDLGATDRDLLWGRLEETAAAGSADYRRLDSRLHLTIAELVGVPSLVPLIADNRSRVNALLDGIPLLQPNIEHSNQQHEAIVAAILRGNPELAEAAMAEHLEGSAALLRGFLR